jgi:hypothetical protein
MRRESHVRACEGGGVRFPSATRLITARDPRLGVAASEDERLAWPDWLAPRSRKPCGAIE